MEVTPSQFDTVRPLFETLRKNTRPRRHDLHDVFQAIVHLLSHDLPWRQLPAHFPPWRSVHEYFTIWTGRTDALGTPLKRALLELDLHDAANKLNQRTRHKQYHRPVHF